MRSTPEVRAWLCERRRRTWRSLGPDFRTFKHQYLDFRVTGLGLGFMVRIRLGLRVRANVRVWITLKVRIGVRVRF